MSSYENVVGGKLTLKGKALDVKAVGLKKKKKKKHFELSEISGHEPSGTGGATGDQPEDTNEDQSGVEGQAPAIDDHLTPAERKYMEQRANLDIRRLARGSGKSHRDRIQQFNEYLANLSEHYDIPKVGPG